MFCQFGVGHARRVAGHRTSSVMQHSAITVTLDEDVALAIFELLSRWSSDDRPLDPQTRVRNTLSCKRLVNSKANWWPLSSRTT